ncbi:MAG: hypothetical protein AAF609_00865 [Cyanobacteria bacterium P01_C01_bin.120]
MHLLYPLESGRAAAWLGRHRVTVQKWAKRDRDQNSCGNCPQLNSNRKNDLPR